MLSSSRSAIGALFAHFRPRFGVGGLILLIIIRSSECHLSRVYGLDMSESSPGPTEGLNFVDKNSTEFSVLRNGILSNNALIILHESKLKLFLDAPAAADS